MKELLLRKFGNGALFPIIDAQVTGFRRDVAEVQVQVISRRGKFFRGSFDAGKVLAGVIRFPLVYAAIDDDGPSLRTRNEVEAVGTGWNGSGADLQVSFGEEIDRLIAGSPDLSARWLFFVGRSLGVANGE